VTVCRAALAGQSVTLLRDLYDAGMPSPGPLTSSEQETVGTFILARPR
jgi:hypothetical protein